MLKSADRLFSKKKKEEEEEEVQIGKRKQTIRDAELYTTDRPVL